MGGRDWRCGGQDPVRALGEMGMSHLAQSQGPGTGGARGGLTSRAPGEERRGRERDRKTLLPGREEEKRHTGPWKGDRKIRRAGGQVQDSKVLA